MIKFIFLVVTSSTYKIVDSYLSIAISDSSNFVKQVSYVTIHGKNKNQICLTRKNYEVEVDGFDPFESSLSESSFNSTSKLIFKFILLDSGTHLKVKKTQKIRKVMMLKSHCQ